MHPQLLRLLVVSVVAVGILSPLCFHPRTGRLHADQGNSDRQPPAATNAEEEAVKVLMRIHKARIDGTVPPAAWPNKIRKVGTAWVVDIDTSTLPGGYPQQIVVHISTTGGHTGKALK